MNNTYVIRDRFGNFVSKIVGSLFLVPLGLSFFSKDSDVHLAVQILIVTITTMIGFALFTFKFTTIVERIEGGVLVVHVARTLRINFKFKAGLVSMPESIIVTNAISVRRSNDRSKTWKVVEEAVCISGGNDLIIDKIDGSGSSMGLAEELSKFIGIPVIDKRDPDLDGII